MTTVNGLFTCADGVGASGHKFSSGSHAEGRICGKQMVRWAVDHKGFKPTLKQTAEELKKDIYRPWYNYEAGKNVSTDPVVNPNYISPKNFMMRLIKCSDEYGGGVGTMYTTSASLLETGFKLLDMLEEDSMKLAARDLHELMRCWEQYHRLFTVRLHMQHIHFRQESRYPGFYYRGDFLGLDDTKWKCFVNSKYDPEKKETTIFKKPYIQVIPD
jgi:adenylylsulfate reductase, subunit A